MEGEKDPRLGHRYSKPGECPSCGARLRVEHGLWPRFYAFEEAEHGKGQEQARKSQGA